MKNLQFLPFLFLVLGLTIVVHSCKDDDEPTPDPCTNVTCQNGGTCADGTCFCPDGFSGPNCEVEDPCHEANNNNVWGYDEYGGPACWDDVCCGTGCSGNKQSPINIVNALLSTNAPALSIQGSETTTKIVHKGHTIEFEQEPGSFITYGFTANGLFDDYTIGQFHFHAKSEHQVSGNHAQLEAHMVCRSIWRNEYIVLSVMVEEGASNPFLAQFVDHLPASKAQPPYENDDLTYNPFYLLPSNHSYFTYSGSLTTPPCSEVVKWIVMENKVTATAAEIEAFSSKIPNTNRPVQPLNGRVIDHVQL
jgi:carbonic anhydrase